MEYLFEDSKQNRLATQVGWPAFKRARRLKLTPEAPCSQPVSKGVADATILASLKLFARGRPEASARSCDIKNGHTITTNSPNRGQSLKSDSRPESATRHCKRLVNLRGNSGKRRAHYAALKSIVISFIIVQLIDSLSIEQNFVGEIVKEGISWKNQPSQSGGGPNGGLFVGLARASLIIGDSAIEIQEVEDNGSQIAQEQSQVQQPQPNQATNLGQSSEQVQSQSAEQQLEQQPQQQSNVLLGSTSSELSTSPLSLGPASNSAATSNPAVDSGQNANSQFNEEPRRGLGVAGSAASSDMSRLPGGPLPPIEKNNADQADDITDGDKKSRNRHDFELNESNPLNGGLNEVLQLSSRKPGGEPDEPDKYSGDKTITGKVVDFELQPAGGHNKAKIKKKKKKKKVEKKKSEESFKKWGKKKKMEKKAEEKKEKKHMKKKKEEGKKGKKKWGLKVEGQKKKGNFKKKKWGKKVKKGKGVKKGKKGKKFLKDKGHKNTGFKTVYHKEEWGKSSKWHDIKREKKWDEKSKKWKKKWKKEKGKKYKGDHMKKFEKKKKEGKKYKKAKKEKFKKFKKEEFEKGKKKKMEEKMKKKEGGAKKEEMKKEKKKKKKKKS